MDPSITRVKTNADKPFLLLPLLPIIFFFLHNANQFLELMATKDVLLLFLVYGILSYLFLVCSKFLCRLTTPQSVFISTLAIICFLFFGYVQDLLFHLKRFSFLSNSLFLLLFIVVMLFSVIIYLKKRRLVPFTGNLYFTALFVLLIIIETGLVTVKLMSGKSFTAITHRMTTPVLNEEKILLKDPPDIYHIIFDEYTNRPALQKYWNYDNEIYPHLASKGFFTIDSATSNYLSTSFSIASIFNMQYLKGAERYLERNSPNFSMGQMLYHDNTLFRFLKSADYNFSVFSLVDDEKLSTGLGYFGLERPSRWLREQTIERIFLNPWMLDKIKRMLGSHDPEPALLATSKQKYAEYNKKAMDHIYSDCQNASRQNVNRPLFSYTHILLPHEPYMLDENGNLSSKPGLNLYDMAGYLAQVKYSNKLIEQITNCLLSDTTRKKIIIFQGDHGYRDYTDPAVSYSTPFNALSAVYFYNKNYTGLKKDLSHVNTYRVIMNNFFGAGLPLLKDSIVIRKRD